MSKRDYCSEDPCPLCDEVIPTYAQLTAERDKAVARMQAALSASDYSSRRMHDVEAENHTLRAEVERLREEAAEHEAWADNMTKNLAGCDLAVRMSDAEVDDLRSLVGELVEALDYYGKRFGYWTGSVSCMDLIARARAVLGEVKS